MIAMRPKISGGHQGLVSQMGGMQEKASDSQKPKVPDPPPSPQRTSSQSIGTTNRKKLKKLVEKAVTSGKKVDKNAFRAIYGAEVFPA